MKKKQSGFTLIELVLYIAIVTIMLASLIPFALNVISGGVKSSVQEEVTSNGRYIVERIKSEIRQSSGISAVSANSISLSNFPPDSTTVIDLAGGYVRINKNGSGPVDLNSANTTVTSLEFTDYSFGGKSENIQVRLTVQSNFIGPRMEYKISHDFETAAEVRSL